MTAADFPAVMMAMTINAAALAGMLLEAKRIIAAAAMKKVPVLAHSRCH